MLTISNEQYVKALQDSGIKNGDVVFFHIDTMIALFMEGEFQDDKFQKILDGIEEAVGSEGTIIIPTFTYSFCKGEVFDVLNTKCRKEEMGLFPNFILNTKNFIRTPDPLFSVAIKGKRVEEFSKVSYIDSFGEGGVFDLLYKLDGKICCIGCSLDRATFIHYCEKKIGTTYRYDKQFSGLISHRDGRDEECTVNYYVRNLEMKLTSDLSLLKNNLKNDGRLMVSSLSRVGIYTVSTLDFFKEVVNILNLNPLGLTKVDKNL